MSEKQNLKPCPFCGGEAHIEFSWSIYYGECNKCFATGPENVTKSNAIKRWNKRTGESK
jgi:Lar family restriction alleviation protein